MLADFQLRRGFCSAIKKKWEKPFSRNTCVSDAVASRCHPCSFSSLVVHIFHSQADLFGKEKRFFLCISHFFHGFSLNLSRRRRKKFLSVRFDNEESATAHCPQVCASVGEAYWGKNFQENMNEQDSYVIGVDLGGTNTVFGLVNPRGDIICDGSIRTREYPDAADFVRAGVACLAPLIARAGGIGNVKAMGIGAPNGNIYQGTIENAPNLPWKGIVPLSQMFSAELGIPVAVTNDANAAAMGEMLYGAARGMKDFIVITLGTGVGSGIVVNGQLVYGHDGFAGELGHVTLVRGAEGRLCGCGRRGCLETYCSATGVACTAREILSQSTQPSLLRDIAPEAVTSLDVSIAAGKGDAVAREIFEFTGRMLGEACADFAAFSSPEAFIFFGGLVRAGDLIMEPIRRAYDKQIMPVFRGKARFLVSELMDRNAAVLGASALGWDTLSK